jgi:hypothetical protein
VFCGAGAVTRKGGVPRLAGINSRLKSWPNSGQQQETGNATLMSSTALLPVLLSITPHLVLLLFTSVCACEASCLTTIAGCAQAHSIFATTWLPSAKPYPIRGHVWGRIKSQLRLLPKCHLALFPEARAHCRCHAPSLPPWPPCVLTSSRQPPHEQLAVPAEFFLWDQAEFTPSSGCCRGALFSLCQQVCSYCRCLALSLSFTPHHHLSS